MSDLLEEFEQMRLKRMKQLEEQKRARGVSVVYFCFQSLNISLEANKENVSLSTSGVHNKSGTPSVCFPCWVSFLISLLKLQNLHNSTSDSNASLHTSTSANNSSVSLPPVPVENENVCSSASFSLVYIIENRMH